MAEASLLARLEAVTSRLEGFANGLGARSGGGASAGGDSKAEVSEKLIAYDNYAKVHVAAFVDVAKKFKDTNRIVRSYLISSHIISLASYQLL